MSRPSGSFKILATSYDYRPKNGGIATLTYQLLQSMASVEGISIRLIAPEEEGSKLFDSQSPVDCKRVPLPSSSTQAIGPLTNHLAKEMLTWKPDAVLNFLWQPEGVATFLAAPVRIPKRIPYFLYAHGVEVLESSQSLKKRIRSMMAPLKKAVFHGAKAILTNSQFTRDLVISRCRVKDSKVHVALPGVDCSQFFPEAPAADLVEKHRLAGKKVFLTLTRLVDYKGVDRAIAALRHVVQSHPNTVYLVCGEGEDRKRLESLTEHYGMQSHVVFTGAIPHDRLRDYYNLADALVMLSRDDWQTPNVEGFGLVFLEAAACAKPSIAGAAGGMRDAVIAGKTGWLVDPTNDLEAARAMLEVLEMPDLARKLGENGRERVARDLSWNQMARRVLEIICAG